MTVNLWKTQFSSSKNYNYSSVGKTKPKEEASLKEKNPALVETDTLTRPTVNTCI